MYSVMGGELETKDVDVMMDNDFKRKSEAVFKRNAWGYFNMPITIHFNKLTKIKPFTVDHMLCFEGNGKS